MMAKQMAVLMFRENTSGGVDEHSFHIRVSAKDGWNDEP